MPINFIKGPKLASFSMGRREASSCPIEEEVQKSSIEAKQEVPKGHLPIYVGAAMTRFVIPIAFLLRPDFRELLERMEEEFGHDQKGGLRVPCEESEFLEMLRITEGGARNERRMEKARLLEERDGRYGEGCKRSNHFSYAILSMYGRALHRFLGKKPTALV